MLKERQNTPQVLPSSGTANSDVSLKKDTKHSVAWGCGNTGDSARPNIGNHTVFVLSVEGEALTPTTSAKARKLLRGGVARKVWSKFNTFGIQLLEKAREEFSETTLGYDSGTKFEGISVVCGSENNLSVKLDLPDKKKIVRKMNERRWLRRNRRYRNCRRRKARFQNRSRKDFIAPSQLVIVNSRLKVLKEFLRIYPIQNVAMEDVKFNHVKNRWGKNFSTMEIGKQKIRDFFKNNNIKIFEYRGFETAEIRKKYGYKKTRVKNADKFSAHCCDSLALAVDVNCGKYIREGIFLVVDDTYRCVRRRLHDSQFSKGGVRDKYSQGSANSVGKGVMIGTSKGKTGQLCGESKGFFRYYDSSGKRQTVKKLFWINNQFKIKEEAHSLAGQLDVVPCA